MTTQAARIRKMVERVKGEHNDYHFSRMVPMGDYCNSCGHEWPCDAARLAVVVETLVTALEFEERYARERGALDVAARMAERLADAARELEGGSDE